MVELVRQNYKENKKIFENVKKVLKNKLDENIPISHVGSTALKGMYGKNIIDILIGASCESEFLSIATILVDLGYIPSKRNSCDYQFFANTSCETHSGDIHIHLVIINTLRYKEFIVLRDYLINNKIEAKKYLDFKRNLILNGITDRNDYKKIKSDYVSNLIKKALKCVNE